jgi:protein TonB
LQPGSIQEDLPYPTDTEPTWGSGIPGGDEEGTTDETGPGSGGMPGGSPIDVRAGVVPPDIVLPVPLETPPPHYPDLARIARATGSVVLSATIATDGRVVEVEVEPGANPLLAPAAVEAVSRWRYVPARIGSRQVAVILRVTLTFRLL